MPPLPAGDVLIHLGDVADKGSLEDVQDFALWLQRQPFAEKIVIEGNHDRDLSTPGRLQLARELGNTARVLMDETVSIAGGRLTVHGAAWASCEADQFGALTSRPDILLTHLPPNVNTGGAQAGGSITLLSLVEKLRIPLHLFGHVHYGRGARVGRNTTFVNAATPTGTPPVVIDVAVNDAGDREPEHSVAVQMVHCPPRGGGRVHAFSGQQVVKFRAELMAARPPHIN